MTLADIINEGWDIRIGIQAKRMEGEDGIRDFYGRVCWRASNGVYNLESRWKGFKYAEEAIGDLISKIEGIKVKSE